MSPRLNSLPGSTSSLPVEITAMRGRGWTRSDPRPTAARTARWREDNRVPAAITRSPTITSSPALRMQAPGVAEARMITVSVPPSVASTGTTASAPSGMGAPVMMRTHVPSVTGTLGR